MDGGRGRGTGTGGRGGGGGSNHLYDSHDVLPFFYIPQDLLLLPSAKDVNLLSVSYVRC